MRSVTLALILAVVALAGCGGGDEPETPTRAEFISQADALCKRVNGDAQRINRRLEAAVDETQDYRSQLQALAPILEEGYELQSASDEEFAALTPPEDDRVVFERLNRAYEDQTSLVSRLADAAASGDTTRFTTLREELERTRVRARGLAQGYGFKVCGSEAASG